MKHHRHDLHGLLLIDKPLSISSMDVIRRVRRHTGGPKAGHAGTLDPLATGLLIVCLGKATKAVPLLMDATKVYETTIDLSALTNTDDAEGERELVEIASPPTREQVRVVLDELTGEIMQSPPAYSAIKIDGQRAYKLARKGELLDIPARPVRIDAIELLDYTFPLLTIRITCGKGTYIRSLARQIGTALGTGGYLTALRRTATGPYTIEDALKLDELPSPFEAEHLLPIPGSP